MADKPDLGSRLKTGVEIVREALIVCLIIVVVAFPKLTASLLSRYGFDTVKTPIGDVSLAKILGAGGSVESAQRSVSDAASALKNLSATLPASAQVQLADVVSHLDSTEVALTVPGQLLTTAAKAKSDTQSSEQQPQGWIYLGQVNDSNNRWIARPPIVTNSPPLKAGDTMTIAADVYIRGDSASSQPNQAPTGIVLAGKHVQVKEVSYSNALSGGKFVWARVTVL